jgi:hypothetical protein
MKSRAVSDPMARGDRKETLKIHLDLQERDSEGGEDCEQRHLDSDIAVKTVVARGADL